MPISGLVITLSDTPELAEIALTMLRRDRRIELGERRGPCQPVVVDRVSRRVPGVSPSPSMLMAKQRV